MSNPVPEWDDLPEDISLPKILQGDKGNGQKRASYWVGAAWSPDRPAKLVVIKPKFQFLQAGLMLADVLGSKTRFSWTTEDRVLLLRTDGDDREPLLRADPAGTRIDLPSDFPADQFLLVQLAAFINALSEMLERRKRMDRTPVRKSFTGEIRGRLNIARSIQKDWASGESHKTVCDLTEPSANIPLNQTLLEAIVRCEAFLNKTQKENALRTLKHKTRRARALLHGVERLSDTSSRHLAKIRSTLRGYYAGFRPIFDLARCIIRNERFVVQPAAVVAARNMTVPFGVNMNLLFEMYLRSCVEKIGKVKLERATNHKVWWEESGSLVPERRPDILGTRSDKKFVIEVKYYVEDWLEKLQHDEKKLLKGSGRPREGFFQAVAYKHLFGAHIAVVTFPVNGDSETIQGTLGADGIDSGSLKFIRFGKDYETKIWDLLDKALG